MASTPPSVHALSTTKPPPPMNPTPQPVSNKPTPQSTPPTPPTSPNRMTRPIRNVRVTAPPPTSPPETFHATPVPSPHTKTRDIPQGKNLRWTAVALVQKLSSERERPSAAVADEIALAACNDLRSLHPHRDMAAVERNTRRRVYDALKVMVSAGCIQREGKALRWIGIDDLKQRSRTHSQSTCTAVRVAICEARRRIARKMTTASDLRARISAFDRFYNLRRDKHPSNCGSTNLILPFPFVLVKTKAPKVAYSNDRHRVRVSAPAKFKLYSETDVVCLIAERRKPRPIARKPRVTRSAQRNHAAKLPPEIPPPPPPSPVDSCLQDVVSNAARRVRPMQPQTLVNLALHTISKTAPRANTISEADKTRQVGRRSDLDVLDAVKAERCLGSEIPVQFVKHEDDEDFFKDLYHKAQAAAAELHPSARGSCTDSSSSDEVGPQFERIVRNDRVKEEFDQDVSMLCEEELSDSPEESDHRESAEILLKAGGKGDGGESSRSAVVAKQEHDIKHATV